MRRGNLGRRVSADTSPLGPCRAPENYRIKLWRIYLLQAKDYIADLFLGTNFEFVNEFRFFIECTFWPEWYYCAGNCHYCQALLHSLVLSEQ